MNQIAFHKIVEQELIKYLDFHEYKSNDKIDKNAQEIQPDLERIATIMKHMKGKNIGQTIVYKAIWMIEKLSRLFTNSLGDTWYALYKK